jgi:hypothetical protein
LFFFGSSELARKKKAEQGENFLLWRILLVCSILLFAWISSEKLHALLICMYDSSGLSKLALK